jgi:hypothetical protein
MKVNTGANRLTPDTGVTDMMKMMVAIMMMKTTVTL